MDFEFKAGMCYVASGVMKETKRKIVVCLGRQGRNVSFGFLNGLIIADVGEFMELDREFVRVTSPNGELYNLSAAVPAEIENSIETVIALREG